MNTPFTTKDFNNEEPPENSGLDIALNDLFVRVIALEVCLGLIGITIIAVLNFPALRQSLTSIFDITYLLSGAFAGAGAAGIILALLNIFPSLMNDMTAKVLGLFREVSVAQAIALGLAAGLGEELLFRGGLQPFLGVLITSVLFALLHPFGWLYITAAFTISLGLGWLAVLTGGLAASVAAHACYDALLFLALRYKILRIPDPPTDIEP